MSLGARWAVQFANIGDELVFKLKFPAYPGAGDVWDLPSLSSSTKDCSVVEEQPSLAEEHLLSASTVILCCACAM